MKKILLISLLCASLLLCACQREKHLNTFAAQTGICLQERGRTLFRYDPLTCQLAFNRDRRTFRVHTDNMSDFYSVELSRIPVEKGEKVTGQVRWTTQRSLVNKKNVTLEAIKLEGDVIWLWCASDRFGCTVRVLE